MELSWSTFILEIINFLVLVWILKHFLYQPVLDIISKRRQSIASELDDAQRQRSDAESLKSDYENRLADWEKERQQMRDNLTGELEEERARQLKALQETLEAEREKAQVTESQRRLEAVREAQLQALRQGAAFATKLLGEATGPELEARLLELLTSDLKTLSEEQLNNLRTQWGSPPDAIQVASAYPLAAEQRQQLEEVLTQVTGLTLPTSYEQDSDLLAGLRICIGAWVLHANLQDELKGFVEFAHVTR